MKLSGLIVVAASLISSAAVAQPAGSPWPLERQDRWSTGRAIYGPDASSITTPWIYRKVSDYSIVSHGASLGPGGIGYVGNWTSNQVLKFDYNTGDVLLSFNALNFVVCTPAIGNGGLVYMSTDGPSGRVFCLNSANMDFEWFYNTGYLGGSPIIGPDGDIVDCNSNTLFRWDEITGAIVWQKAISGGHATVAFSRDDTKVFVGTGNKMSAYRYSDGLFQWERDVASSVASPGVAPDGTVIFGNDAGTVYAVNPDTGVILWTKPTLAAVKAGPSFSLDGTVAYVCSDDHRLYAFRMSDGFKLWSFTSSNLASSAPSVDIFGRIYFHNRGGDVYCIDPSGAQIWTVHLNGESRGPMSIGPDNTLYVGYAGGNDRGLAMIRQQATVAPLAGLSIERGALVSGGLAEVLASDDSYLMVRPGAVLTSAEYPVRIVVTATSPKPLLASFKLSVEVGGLSAAFNQKIEMLNYSTNQYELLDSRPSSLNDTSVEVSVATNASRFVNSSTGEMSLKVSAKATQPILIFPWQLKVDAVSLSVVPQFVP